MAIRTLLAAKSGIDGATLVTGGSGNTDLDSLVIANAAGTSTVRLNFPTTGNRGARFNSNTTSGTNYGQETVTGAGDKLKLEIPYRHEANPTGDANVLWIGNGGSTRALVIQAGAAGVMRFRNATQVLLGSTTGVVPLASNDYVLLFFVNRATGVGKLQIWLRGAAAPITNGSLSYTGADFGALSLDTIRIGSKASTGAFAYDNTFGDVIIDTDATDIGSPSWLGPPVIDTTPTESPCVFVNLSGTTVTTGPVAYTATPSTGTQGTSTGIYLPASTTVPIAYTITATDTGGGSSSTLSYTVQPIAGAAQARQRSRIYDGTNLL